MKGKVILVLLLIGFTSVVVSCAPGHNPLAGSAYNAGFWPGVWHGVSFPISFIVKLFLDSIHFYEVHNNGNWYDIGFVVGLVMAFNISRVLIREVNDRMGW